MPRESTDLRTAEASERDSPAPKKTTSPKRRKGKSPTKDAQKEQGENTVGDTAPVAQANPRAKNKPSPGKDKQEEELDIVKARIDSMAEKVDSLATTVETLVATLGERGRSRSRSRDRRRRYSRSPARRSRGGYDRRRRSRSPSSSEDDRSPEPRRRRPSSRCRDPQPRDDPNGRHNRSFKPKGGRPGSGSSGDGTAPNRFAKAPIPTEIKDAARKLGKCYNCWQPWAEGHRCLKRVKQDE